MVSGRRRFRSLREIELEFFPRAAVKGESPRDIGVRIAREAIKKAEKGATE